MMEGGPISAAVTKHPMLDDESSTTTVGSPLNMLNLKILF